MAFTEATIKQYQHPRIKLVVGGTSEIVFPAPPTTTIYEPDIVSGSFSYKTGTSSGGAFGPGGCVTASISFAVRNKTGEYSDLFVEDTKVRVYFGYGATYDTAEYELIGYFYVTDVKKQNQKISVQAFDWLRKADKIKWTFYEFPMTVRDIIHTAASQAGIGYIVGPTDGGTISVDLRDSDGNQPTLNLTCRQAIAAALEISGNYAYVSISSNGYEQLNCGWYPRTADATLTASWLRDYTIKDSRAYTGVQVFGQAISGTSERLFVMSSATFLTDANKADVQARLYDALVGLSVCEANISAVYNPNIRPGQVLSMTFPQAGSTRTITTPITSISIKGGMVATYSSEDINADEADDLREDGKDYATIDYVNSAVAGASNRDIVSIDVAQALFSNNDEYVLPSPLEIALVHSSIFTNGTSSEFVKAYAGAGGTESFPISWGRQIIQVPTYQSCLADAQRLGKTIAKITFPVSIRLFSGASWWEECGFRGVPPRCEIMCFYESETTICIQWPVYIVVGVMGQVTNGSANVGIPVHAIVSLEGRTTGRDSYIFLMYINDDNFNQGQFNGQWMNPYDVRYQEHYDS